MSGDASKTQRLPMRPRSRERLLVVGDGPVARALSAALAAADVTPLRWTRKDGKALPAADVVVLAVRDEAIGEVAAQIMARVDDETTPPILLHCAGAPRPAQRRDVGRLQRRGQRARHRPVADDEQPLARARPHRQPLRLRDLAHRYNPRARM